MIWSLNLKNNGTTIWSKKNLIVYKIILIIMASQYQDYQFKLNHQVQKTNN